VAAVVHQTIPSWWDTEALDKAEEDVHEAGEVHSRPFREEASEVDHIPKIPSRTVDTDNGQDVVAVEEGHRDKQDGDGQDQAEEDKVSELDEGARLEDGETRSGYLEEVQPELHGDDHSPQ
jgi:hypothetical protein